MLYCLLKVSLTQSLAEYCKKNPLLVVLMCILLAAALGVGGYMLYLWLSNKEKTTAQQASENTATEKEETPDTEPQVIQSTKETPCAETKSEEESKPVQEVASQKEETTENA